MDRRLRVLMLERKDSASHFGGEQVHLRRLSEELGLMGCEVEISSDPRRAEAGFDLLHLWNLQHPFEAEGSVRALAPFGIPIALTPIYNDLRRAAFSLSVQERLAPLEGAALEKALEDLALGRFEVEGAGSFRDLMSPAKLRRSQRYLLEQVDLLLPMSRTEVSMIRGDLGHLPGRTGIAHVGSAAPADPDPFRERSGIQGPYVLLPAARIEPNKNQWLTLLALRDLDLPIVVTGTFTSETFESLCRRSAPPRTLFPGLLPPGILASALAGAELVLHVSVIECMSLSALDAARACGSLVVGHTGGEKEYFGDLARVVPPLDVFSIRTQAFCALQGSAEEASRREALKRRVAEGFTWEGHARKVLGAYERCLAEVPA